MGNYNTVPNSICDNALTDGPNRYLLSNDTGLKCLDMCEKDNNCTAWEVTPAKGNIQQQCRIWKSMVDTPISAIGSSCNIKKLQNGKNCLLNSACFTGICDKGLCSDKITDTSNNSTNIANEPAIFMNFMKLNDAKCQNDGILDEAQKYTIMNTKTESECETLCNKTPKCTGYNYNYGNSDSSKRCEVWKAPMKIPLNSIGNKCNIRQFSTGEKCLTHSACMTERCANEVCSVAISAAEIKNNDSIKDTLAFSDDKNNTNIYPNHSCSKNGLSGGVKMTSGKKGDLFTAEAKECYANPSCVGMDSRNNIDNGTVELRQYTDTSITPVLDKNGGVCVLKKQPLNSKCIVNTACSSGICNGGICVKTIEDQNKYAAIDKSKYASSSSSSISSSSSSISKKKFTPVEIAGITIGSLSGLAIIITLIVLALRPRSITKSTFGRRRR
jgi:hypothetical protein